MTEPAQATPTRINYHRWVWRIVTWDGVIAILVMIAPLVVQRVMQKQGEEAEQVAMVSSVFIPIGAFLLRWGIGRGHILKNHCGPTFRQVQTFCFYVGLLSILLGESIALCIHAFMKDEGAALAAIVALTPFYLLYVLLMIVAMYPGREPIPAEEITRVGNWDVGM